MSKYVSAYNGVKREEPKKKKYVSAYSDAERNRGGLAEGAGYVAGSLGLGLAGVGEGVLDIAAASRDILRGDTEMAKYRFLDNHTADAQQSLNEWYNPGKGMQFAGDVASGIGQSSVFLLDALVPGLGTGLFFGGITGQSVAGAAQQTGDVGLKEIGYGVASGAAEAALGKLVGAGGKVAGKLGSSLTRSTGKAVGQRGITNALTKATGKKLAGMGWNVAQNTLADAAGEFAEEFTAEYIDTGLQRLFGIDPNASTSFGEALRAGAVGLVSGAAMGAPANVYNYKNSAAAGRAIREEGGVDQLLYRAAATVDVLKEQEEQAREKGRTKATVPEDVGAVGKTAAKGKQIVANLGDKIKASKTKGYWTKLEKNINAYTSMDEAMRNSEAGDALLGELRGNLFFTNMSYAVEEAEEALKTATDEQITEWLVEVNDKAKKAGKADANYTVEDFRANKDGILSTVAAAFWIDEIRRAAKGTGSAEKGTVKPTEPAQAPKDTTAEQVNAQEQNADTEDLSGIEEEVWRAVTDETVKGYGTQNEQEVALLRAAVTHGVPEKSIPLMLERFREGTDMKPAEFADAWADGVLFFGRLGLNEATISQESALSRMSEKARHASVEYGKWLSEEQRAKEQEAAKKKKRPVKEGASKKPKGEVVRHPGINLKEDLDDAQFTAYKAAEIMAPALKADIEIHKGLMRDGKEVNGYYDIGTNTIHININAVRDGKHIALYTLGHEVAHYIKAWSPKKFYELGDYVMDQLGEKAERAVRDKLDFLKRNGLVDGLDETEAYDRAYEEVAADGMELVLTDGTVLDALARENKTLWQKIKDRIFEIIEKIKKAYGDLSKTSRTAQILSETMDSLDDIEQLFYEGVREAGERTRTAGVTTSTNEENMQVRYSVGGDAQTVFQAEYEKDVDAVLNNTYRSKSVLLLGRTPRVLMDIGLNQLPVVITPKHVYSIAKTEKEAKQEHRFDKRDHYHGLGDVSVKQIMEKISDPLMIISHQEFTQEQQDNHASAHKIVVLVDFTVDGKQVICPIEVDATINHNSTQIDANVISTYFNKASVDEMVKEAVAKEYNGETGFYYINKKKANSFLQNTGYQLPQEIASKLSAYGYIIRQIDSNVNRKIKNFTQSKQFTRFFGDWQNNPSKASKVVNADGTPKILYHQTAEDFTVFDPEHTGAGTTDFETPFGIFMKPTDSDIGLKGQKQMALYANIRKPLEANDRADLVEKLKSLSQKYTELLNEMQSMNEEYKSKIDDAFNAWLPFVEEYRKTHPQVSRREILLDAEAKKVYDEPQRLTEEWTKRSDALAVKCKEEINRTLKAHGYDGVHIREDAGSGGRSTETYIALDPEQVKSATDNIGTFDGTNPDIRYSIDETPETPDVSENETEKLEAENEELTRRVQRLRYDRFRQAAASGEIDARDRRRELSRGVDRVLDSIGVSDGRNRRELFRRMTELYERMAAKDGISYEQAFDEAGEIADWLISAQPSIRDAEASERAGEILKDVTGTRIRLTYTQKADVTAAMGSTEAYRKAMFGRITLSDTDGVPLDQQWAEWSETYPEVFPEDVAEGDMPERLLQICKNTKDMRDRTEPAEIYFDGDALTATIFTEVGQIGWRETKDMPNDYTLLADSLSGAARNVHEYRIIKDFKAMAAELQEAEDRRRELKKKAAKANKQIEDLRRRIKEAEGADTTATEAELSDVLAEKQGYLSELDELETKIAKASKDVLSIRAAAPLRRILAEEVKRADAMERSAERARQREMDSKEWAKETVKKAREESEEKVKKARQEAQDYKAAVYKTSMEKVYKARRDATDYKQAVYRTAYAKADEKNQKYRDKLDEMAKRSMERREIAIRMREARRVLGYLNTMLYHPTKQKHVLESLQALVEKALLSADPKQFGINRDHIREMSELAGKIRKLESKAGRTTSEQETLDKMKTKYEKLEADTISVKRQAEALMTAFEQYVTSTTDGVMVDKDMLEGLRQTVTEIEEAPLNEMTLKSLQAVEKIYTVIYHQVNTANQAFATEKAANIDEMSTKANTQVKNAKELKFLSPRAGEWAGLAGARSYLWKNMKPLTVFEAIGSDELMSIFKRVLDGEDVWITDILEAKKALDEAKKEYGYNKWNLKERREVTTADGSKVSLTLGEMMSLYAYMFRDQAEEHLSVGGFVFAPNAEAIESFKGDKGKYRTHLNDQTPHRMRLEDIAKMSALLTEEQRAYARAVQEYLTSLGAKGNEVSRKLYGIDLFKETAYFPIKSSHDYIETSTGKSGDPNIKSRGTFKETVPRAGNPIVLEDFMEVVGNHVNTMATYHAFVLPVEDLTRVWNYTPVNIKRDADGKAILDENGMPVADTEGEAGYNSLKAEITKKYGKEANDYILQLLRDLNGGARRESAASILDKGLTAFKRSATMLSLSTIVQQPTSIIRAMAYVDAKHFTGASFVPWETVKKYAPVAAIKEVGGHDTNTGARTVDYINAKEYDSIKDAAKAAVKPEIYGGDPNVRAEAFGWLTGKADEVSWRYLFGAIVNEQAEKLGKAKDSEAVLKAAGERFAEVVRRTQVYDSTLTRSEYMRSKDGLMKMATAFGAEPTTVVSMAVDAIIKAERGDKTFLRKSAAGIAFSIIANAAVASLIYAMRDDDEDETIPEKYVQSLTSELIEGFNPLEYLPIARDIMSMFKGYEIERSDMALIGNLMEQVELITNSKRSVPDKIFGVTGAVSAFFGLPVTNVYRDLKGLVKTGQSFTNAEEQTGAGFGFAMSDAVSGQFNLFAKLFGAESGNAYELYTSYVRGDTAHYERVKARYKTDKDAEMALRTELRDNDKRINQAAWAKHEGDLDTYESVIDQIESEGVFDRNIVIRAINNEVSEIKREIEEDNIVPRDATDTEEDETTESLYNTSDLNDALTRGDREDFGDIYYYLLATKQEQGKTEAQAKAAVKSGITSYWRKQYLAAWEENNTAEMKRILELLEGTELYGEYNDVATMAQKWIQES